MVRFAIMMAFVLKVQSAHAQVPDLLFGTECMVELEDYMIKKQLFIDTNPPLTSFLHDRNGLSGMDHQDAARLIELLGDYVLANTNAHAAAMAYINCTSSVFALEVETG